LDELEGWDDLDFEEWLEERLCECEVEVDVRDELTITEPLWAFLEVVVEGARVDILKRMGGEKVRSRMIQEELLNIWKRGENS